MNDVMISRRAGELNGYLNPTAMNMLIDALQKAKDYEDLPNMFKSWLQSKENIQTRYISFAAKQVRKAQK